MPALDHLILLADDLEAAAATAEKIGFTMNPLGRHPKLGTCNRLAMLEHTYLELLAVEQINERTAIYSDWLQRGTGTIGLALAGSASDEFDRLSSLGIAIDPPLHFDRPVKIDGREELARFSITRLKENQTPGAFAFICEHHTPEFVWKEKVSHPNGCKDVAVLRFLCRDPDAVSSAYSKLSGTPAEAWDEALCVHLDNVRLEFVERGSPNGLPLGEQVLGGEECRLIAVEFSGSTTSEWRTWPGFGIAYRTRLAA